MGVKVRERPAGSGVYWVFVDYRGKRKAKRVGSEKAALKAKEQIEARLTLGKSAFPEEKKKADVPTLAEYYERFQRNYLSVAVTSSTKISYDVSFRKHILPEFGSYRLDEISRSMVKDFIANLVGKETVRFNRTAQRNALRLFVEQWPHQALKARKFLQGLSSWLKSNPEVSTEALEQHLAESLKLAFDSQDARFQKRVKQLILGNVLIRKMARPSIRIILSELTAVLNSAIEDGIISENPAKRLTKFYKSAPVVHEEIQPLTHEEVPLFLEATLQHSPEYYPLFLCAIHTGLRSGELTGLQWGDIDWSGKFLTVRRNIVRGNVHRTKTGSTRRVDMSDALLSELSSLKRLRQEEWLSRGLNEIPEWVFCNREGNPVDMHNVINRHFKKCLAKAGLRQIRWHDLRHSFASLLIQNGQSLKYVSDQLGHSSIKMTADVYGHLVPGANRQAMNSLPSIDNPKDAKTIVEA
jgi:integrase